MVSGMPWSIALIPAQKLGPILNSKADFSIPEITKTRLHCSNTSIGKTTKAATRLLPRKNDRAWLSLPLHSHNYNYKNVHNKIDQIKKLRRPLSLQESSRNNKTADQNSRERNRVSQVNSSNAATVLTQWLPIPPRLRAYPSYYEQLRRAHNPKPVNQTQNANYFEPLCTILFEHLLEMSDEELIDLTRVARSDINNEMEQPGTPPDAGLHYFSSTQKSTVVTAGVDDLDQILGLPQIPLDAVQLSPPPYGQMSTSSPLAIKHVRLEITMRNCAKHMGINERLVKFWSICKKFDNQVVVCPISNELLPALRNDGEIRSCFLNKYFHSRMPARKQHPSVLQGMIILGITTDEKDFVAALKDWVNSYGHEIVRTDRAMSSVVVGFLINMPLNTNKTVAENSIKSTREYRLLGKPDLYLRLSKVYGKSSHGGPDAAPAWCVECAKDDLDAVVKLCETIFTGSNNMLPSCLRAACYLPTKSIPVGHPARQSYIRGQLAFLSSELTVTCHGLQDIYNMVRLQKDPTIQTTVEDVLMSIPAVNGKLFRSADMTATEETKVFLRFD